MEATARVGLEGVPNTQAPYLEGRGTQKQKLLLSQRILLIFFFFFLHKVQFHSVNMEGTQWIIVQ